jgi:hypothetical protein
LAQNGPRPDVFGHGERPCIDQQLIPVWIVRNLQYQEIHVMKLVSQNSKYWATNFANGKQGMQYI